MFEMETLVTVTQNFRDDNQLGLGGFGLYTRELLKMEEKWL